MHHQETNDSESKLILARDYLLEKMPEAIQVFDHDDATYFLFSEFGEYIIKNISNSQIVKKSVTLITELLEKNEEVIETLVVIEIFQKIYLNKKSIFPFRAFLNQEIQSKFDTYYMEFYKTYGDY